MLTEQQRPRLYTPPCPPLGCAAVARRRARERPPDGARWRRARRRVARYYTHGPEYVREGPPVPLMRFLVAPVLVARDEDGGAGPVEHLGCEVSSQYPDAAATTWRADGDEGRAGFRDQLEQTLDRRPMKKLGRRAGTERPPRRDDDRPTPRSRRAMPVRRRWSRPSFPRRRTPRDRWSCARSASGLPDGLPRVRQESRQPDR